MRHQQLSWLLTVWTAAILHVVTLPGGVQSCLHFMGAIETANLSSSSTRVTAVMALLKEYKRQHSREAISRESDASNCERKYATNCQWGLR